jgi:hypothetical protein
MKKLQQEIINGLNSEKKVFIFINVNSPKRWWWSYHLKGSKRVYEALGIRIEEKDMAIRKAKERYFQSVGGVTKMTQYSSDLLYGTHHIGTFRLMDPDFREWLKTQNHTSGGYVYMIFPSNQTIEQEEIQTTYALDSLVSNMGHFQKENLVRGKIGCSGTGKSSAKSLESRMMSYMGFMNGAKTHIHGHRWMNAALHGNDEWYVIIFSVYAENESKKIANTQAVEKVVINGVSQFLDMVPMGNLEESASRINSRRKIKEKNRRVKIDCI